MGGYEMSTAQTYKFHITKLNAEYGNIVISRKN